MRTIIFALLCLMSATLGAVEKAATNMPIERALKMVGERIGVHFTIEAPEKEFSTTVDSDRVFGLGVEKNMVLASLQNELEHYVLSKDLIIENVVHVRYFPDKSDVLSASIKNFTFNGSPGLLVAVLSQKNIGISESRFGATTASGTVGYHAKDAHFNEWNGPLRALLTQAVDTEKADWVAWTCCVHDDGTNEVIFNPTRLRKGKLEK